jgi:hypothetical protein
MLKIREMLANLTLVYMTPEDRVCSMQIPTQAFFNQSIGIQQQFAQERDE